MLVCVFVRMHVEKEENMFKKKKKVNKEKKKKSTVAEDARKKCTADEQRICPFRLEIQLDR